MDLLSFAQTFFYFSLSLAIIVVGALLSIFLYHAAAVSKHLHQGFDNITTVSSRILDKVSALFGRLVGMIVEALDGHKKNSKKK